MTDNFEVHVGNEVLITQRFLDERKRLFTQSEDLPVGVGEVGRIAAMKDGKGWVATDGIGVVGQVTVEVLVEMRQAYLDTEIT